MHTSICLIQYNIHNNEVLIFICLQFKTNKKSDIALSSYTLSKKFTSEM